MLPLVSVIMSLYNTPSEWLIQALDSIVNQTYKNFEFIIFTDCPTDESEKIVSEYADRDERLKIFKNETNAGLTANLYRAVSISKGKYIARMDSDDISCLNRFAKQVEYLEEHEDVAVVGSMINSFSHRNNTIGMNNLSDSKEVTRIRMLFANAGVAHPSAMIRKSFLVDHNINYNLNYKKSQDYGLWVDIVDCGGKIDMLPEILLDYRVHDNQISKKHSNEQNDCAKAIIKSQLCKLLPDLTEDNFKTHLALTAFNMEIPKKAYTTYIKKLLLANKGLGVYSQKDFKKEIYALWQKDILKACKSGHFGFLFGSISAKALSPSIIIYNYKKLRKRKQGNKILKRYLIEKSVSENE